MSTDIESLNTAKVSLKLTEKEEKDGVRQLEWLRQVLTAVLVAATLIATLAAGALQNQLQDRRNPGGPCLECRHYARFAATAFYSSMISVMGSLYAIVLSGSKRDAPSWFSWWLYNFAILTLGVACYSICAVVACSQNANYPANESGWIGFGVFSFFMVCLGVAVFRAKEHHIS